MQVVACCLWKVKINDVTNERNIEAPRSQISCNQDLSAIDLPFEVFEVTFSDSGRDISVHACRLNFLFAQSVLDGASSVNRIAEDDATCVVLLCIFGEFLH